MKKVIICILSLLVIFSACTKLKQKRAQKQLEGTYDVQCSYAQPEFDSIHGYYTQYGQSSDVWEVSIVDDKHIMIGSLEYELASEDEPNIYVSSALSSSSVTITFFPPDSLTYRNYCCGHFGRSTTCNGYKR